MERDMYNNKPICTSIFFVAALSALITLQEKSQAGEFINKDPQNERHVFVDVTLHYGDVDNPTKNWKNVDSERIKVPPNGKKAFGGSISATSLKEAAEDAAKSEGNGVFSHYTLSIDVEKLRGMDLGTATQYRIMS